MSLFSSHNSSETSKETAAPSAAEQPARLLWRLIKNPPATVALIWLSAVLGASIFANVIAPYSPTKADFRQIYSLPSWAHLLGTDQLGRDILSRIMFGGLISVQAVFVATICYVAASLPLGLGAGYFGGRVDLVVSRYSEMLQTLPGLILLFVILAVFGNDMYFAMVALGLIAAPSLIRVSRAVTLSVREELFVAAAKVFGLSDFAIIMRHVLPRIRSAVIVQTALFAGSALMVQSSLAFLGFGPQPPNPTWGGMIGEAAKSILSKPWQVVPPGLAIGLSVLSLGLIGNAIRDAVSETWSRSQANLLLRGGVSSSEARNRKEPPDPTGGLVQIRDLGVSVSIGSRCVPVVRSVDLSIVRGEAVGVVGESGCGKTLMSLGLLSVLPPGAQLSSGAVYLDGQDVTAMSIKELDAVRGRRIGYVSQDPAVALDPMFTVGSQLWELVRRLQGGSRTEIGTRVIELLSMVRLPNPETVARRYPHQLSGGMAQRVCIALALAGSPELLVADEPTTALDVTTQAEILALLRELKSRLGMAILLVTHDWGVVAGVCDRAVVMYAGQIVEQGSVAQIFSNPKHPYTAALLASNPHIAVDKGDLSVTGVALKPLPTIPGLVPPPIEWGPGCVFAPRCRYATDACAQTIEMTEVEQGHGGRCIHMDLVHADHLRVTPELEHIQN